MSVPVNQIQQSLAQQQVLAAGYVPIFYAYTMKFANVASTAAATAQIFIQADSAFMILQTVVDVIDLTTGLDLTTAPGVIQLTDTSSGATIFDQAIPLGNIAGTASLPYIWAYPKTLTPNSVLTGQLTAGTLTNNSTYYLTFLGLRLYKPG